MVSAAGLTLLPLAAVATFTDAAPLLDSTMFWEL